MGWKFLHIRAVSAAISFSVLSLALGGCAGTDPNLLNGYWRVSEVQTQSLGASQRRENWQVPETSAYILGFKGNQMMVPTQGAGFQSFELPAQGGHYQFEDERISVGNGAPPLQVHEIDERSMRLSQTVNTPDRGSVEVEQTFEKIDPADVRRMLTDRREELPPDLAGYRGDNYPNPNPTTGPMGPAQPMPPGYIPEYGRPRPGPAGVPLDRSNPDYRRPPMSGPNPDGRRAPMVPPQGGGNGVPGYVPGAIPGSGPGSIPGSVPPQGGFDGVAPPNYGGGPTGPGGEPVNGGGGVPRDALNPGFVPR